MEFQGWTALVLTEKITNKHLYLIKQLQRIHDNTKEEDWSSELRDLSNELGFEFKF